MVFGFPQLIRKLITLCGAALALTLVIFSLLTTTGRVAANPMIQESPLSPLPTTITSSAAGDVAGNETEDDTARGDDDVIIIVKEEAEATTESAQPDSPLPTEILTATTPAAIVEPTISVELTMEAADEEVVVEATLPVETATPEPPTPSPTPFSPPISTDERNFTDLFVSGQISIALVGALFAGLLFTIGLVLTRK